MVGSNWLNPGLKNVVQKALALLTFIGTRQKTPLLAAGMDAALLLVLVMLYSLDVSLNCFVAHFSRGSDIVTSRPYPSFAELPT